VIAAARNRRRNAMHIKDLIPWARHDETAQPKGSTENPLAELQRQMNQVFESFWGKVDRPLACFDWPFGEATPRSDVVETADGVEVTIELPGMEQKDVDVSLTDDTLTIKGEKQVEKKDEKRGYYVSERTYGSVFRTVPLPPGVDTGKAEATFRNGVLTVRIPQTPEARAKVKRIEVRAA
jgi:HSP20 family protein